MGPKKAKEWYFGVHHEDVLDSTLKARERAQRRLVASLGGDKKVEAENLGAKMGAKTPISDLIRVLRDVIQARYDDIFDAFTEVDLNSNGRLRCAPCVGMRKNLSVSSLPRDFLLTQETCARCFLAAKSNSARASRR